MSRQTTPQILRCFILGGYAAHVEGGELRVRGPQPLAGPLPASIRERRDELVGLIEEWCGGGWPPTKDSEFYTRHGETVVTPDGKVGETDGLPPWDAAWAAEQAAAALRYLGRNAPEVSENMSILEPHEEAAHQAAMRGDEVAYLEALRAYCRAGRDGALRIRRAA